MINAGFQGSSLSFLETDQESQMSNMSMSSIKSDLQWLTEKDLMGDGIFICYIVCQMLTKIFTYLCAVLV